MYNLDFVEVDFTEIPEKTFCVDNIGNMVYLYCDTAREARLLQFKLQSLDGSNIERDGAFIYCVVNNMGEAISELEDCGFNWEEVC